MEQNYELLVKRLCELPSESSWVEFKHNKYEPDMVGQDISALANGATLADKDYAYMVWGIDCGYHFPHYYKYEDGDPGNTQDT